MEFMTQMNSEILTQSKIYVKLGVHLKIALSHFIGPQEVIICTSVYMYMWKFEQK